MKQRGTITKRGKNSWQLKFDVARKGGKRQQRYATVKGTRQDAQKKLTELLAASDIGNLPEPSQATVATYLRAWLGSSHSQSPKTLERYRQLAEHQIFPHLGDTKLTDLKPLTIRTWHGTLLGTGLGARTVAHAHRLLGLVLTFAVKDRVVARNVAKEERPPKPADEEIEVLTGEAISALFDKLVNHPLSPIAAVALGTGARRGEILGLQWGDIDLDRSTLAIERSVEETEAGLRLKSPKTKRGRRSVSLAAETVTVLRAHKVAQLKLRLQLGMGNITPETLVFSNIDGGLLSPDNLSRDWRRALVKHRLPLVKFHALRHTHASILISKGVDILTISRRLGHSKASITLDVYGHLMKGGDAAAAAAIEGVLK